MFDKTTEEEKIQDINESDLQILHIFLLNQRLKPLLVDYFHHSVDKLKIHLMAVKFKIKLRHHMSFFLIHASLENMLKDFLISHKGARVSNSPCN